MKLLVLKGIAGAVWVAGENGLTHTGPRLVDFKFETRILGRICSQGAVNKSGGESRGEGRGEGLELWGLCVLWDQVRMGKAEGRNPDLFGEDEMDSHIVAGR